MNPSELDEKLEKLRQQKKDDLVIIRVLSFIVGLLIGFILESLL